MYICARWSFIDERESNWKSRTNNKWPVFVISFPVAKLSIFTCKFGTQLLVQNQLQTSIIVMHY